MFLHVFLPQTAKFMSDMGGAMGMCIGASFITAVEFVELFTDLIVLFLTKVFKSKKHKKSNKVNIKTNQKLES